MQYIVTKVTPANFYTTQLLVVTLVEISVKHNKMHTINTLTTPGRMDG